MCFLSRILVANILDQLRLRGDTVIHHLLENLFYKTFPFHRQMVLPLNMIPY